MWLPYHDPRACWGFAAGLRQRIAPRAYGPAVRLTAARSEYHALREDGERFREDAERLGQQHPRHPPSGIPADHIRRDLPACRAWSGE